MLFVFSCYVSFQFLRASLALVAPKRQYHPSSYTVLIPIASYTWPQPPAVKDYF